MHGDDIIVLPVYTLIHGTTISNCFNYIAIKRP